VNKKYEEAVSDKELKLIGFKIWNTNSEMHTWWRDRLVMCPSTSAVVGLKPMLISDFPLLGLKKFKRNH
jgi:hypothetical protein